MAHTSFVRGDEFAKMVCAALEIPFGRVRRVVVDSGLPQEPLTVHVEMYGGLEMLEILPSAFAGAKIMTVNKP